VSPDPQNATVYTVEIPTESDEVIAVHQFRWSEVLQMVQNGTIVDCKTLTAVMFVQCFYRKP